jgi:D-amino-acid dehydrogenase
VVDSLHQITITRLGQRALPAVPSWAGKMPHHAPLQQLYLGMNEWLRAVPCCSGLGAARHAAARWRLWRQRPRPVANTGHGAGGWALASGCARAVADLIGQRSPDVSLDGLGIQRF